VSKQTTEKVQGANPGLLLFENQNNSWSTISWSAVQKTKIAHVSSGKVYIIVDQNGLFSWFWRTNFSFLSLKKVHCPLFVLTRFTPIWQSGEPDLDNPLMLTC
jgi:hypothetical protein